MSYRTAQLKKSLASLFCLFLLAAYCLLLSADFSYAAINESFTFQGKIVDDDGTNLVNGDASCVSVGGADTCDFRVSLYTAVSGGTLVWQETKSNVELYDNDGIFNLFLDCGGTFSSCNQNGGPNFNSGDLFIQVEFDPDGDGDFAEGETFSPRRELSAVPYAFNAKQLDGQEGGSYLRSDATDAYTSGTLSFNSATELNTLSGSTLDVDGDLEIADTNITLNGATTTFNASGALTLLSTGDIAFQPDNDTDDYLYFDTTTNIPGLFWEGIAGTDPGIYVAGTELGYRDESDAWVSFDSLAVGTSPGGSDTQLQYNNGGSFGGVASLTYNDATDEITILDDFTITFDHAENLEITSSLSGGNRTADIFGLSVANDASYDFSTGNVVSLSLLDTGSSADLAELTNAGTGLSFRVNDESGDTTPFVIDEAGYVGIGEDDPQYPLDVNGTGVNLFVNIGSATNQTSISSARFTTDTGYGLIYKNGSGYSQYGGTNALGLWNQTGPINFSPNNMQSAMLLDTAGSLGIADTTPDAKLEVLATTEQLRLTHTDNTYDAKFTVDGSGNLTVATTANFNFQPNGDADDYLYMNTAANIPGLFWEGIAGTDPGIYVAGTELGYRDESDAWVSFDSLAVDNDTTYTAGNGLTLDTGVFELGGTLTQATTITQGNNHLGLDLTGTGDFILYDNGSEFVRFYDTGTAVIQSSSNVHSGLFQVGDNGQGFDDYLISAYGTQDADGAADTDYGMELYVSTVSDHLSDVLYGLNLVLTNSSSVNSVQRGISLVNSNTSSNSITEALIALDNLETTASTVTDGLIITSSGVNNGIVDAIDVSAANLTNAINIGQNYILGDGIRQSSSSSTVWLFEETSGGNDLISITNSSGVGDLSVTGDLTLMGGDITGANSAAIDLGEAVSGNISFYPNGDTDDYLYMNTASDIPGLFWEGIAATDPGIYVSGTELGYRDEADAWVSFDTLSNDTIQLDTVYDQDGDAVLNIDSTSGLMFDMTTTGAFAIRDGTTAFWTFDDDSTVDVVFPAAGNLGISYSAAPTSDFLSLSNAGFGTTTDGVDGLSINFVQGDDDVTDENVALRLTLDPSNDDMNVDYLTGLKITPTGSLALNETSLYGINIEGGSITSANDAIGLVIQSGWPYGLYSYSPIAVLTGDLSALSINTSGMATSQYAAQINTGSATGAGTSLSALNLSLGNDPADSGDTMNGLNVISTAQAQSGSTINLVNLDPTATGNTAGTLNGLRIDSITANSATETAISIGSGWDTGIDAGSNVILNIGNSGTDFNTSGGLTLANSLTVTTGGATVSAGGLTITSGALAVNSDSITSDGELVIDGTTSVVLGTTTNGLRINETFGATSGYLGNARPTKTITLSPEYAGAVLTAFYGAGTDSNITGTMTSDADTTQGTSIRNYYQWERTNSTEHFHTIAVRVTLPSDFAGWQTNGVQVSHITESGTSTNSELDVRIYNENSATIVAQDNDNASTSWASVDIAGATLDDNSGSEWDEAGETAVIYLRLGSQSGNWSRVGDIKLNYYSRF